MRRVLSSSEKEVVMKWAEHVDMFGLKASELDADLKKQGVSEMERDLAWSGVEFLDHKQLCSRADLSKKLDSAFWAEDEDGDLFVDF